MKRFRRAGAGFTLVELLVSAVLVGMLAVILAAMTNATSRTWTYAAGRIEEFRGAETAFEAMNRRLSQATLNTYWDYDSPAAPKKYLRQSELRFIAGRMTGKATDNPKPLLPTVTPRRPGHAIFFQAPLGYVDDPVNFSELGNLLNSWGYYLEFNQDTRPAFIEQMARPPALRYRYRLMEFMPPSNALALYARTSGHPEYTGREWFTDAFLGLGGAPLPAHVLAENVIALVFLPRLSARDEQTTGKYLSRNYAYDSTNPTNITDPDINPKNQLPPIVQVTLVAIDEASAARQARGAAPPVFDALLDKVFIDAAKFDADLSTLQTAMAQAHPPIGCRVFTTNVALRGAKWSRK